MPIKPLFNGSSAMMCSRLVKTRRPIRDLVHTADGLADHRIGVVTNFAVRHQIIRPDQVARIDIGFRYELVDLDGARAFERDVFKLVLRHLDIGVLIDLEALHDVVGRDFVTSLGIHLLIFDAVAGVAIDLIESDLFAVGTSPETARRGR